MGLIPWLVYLALFLGPTSLVAWGQWKARGRSKDQDAAREELKKTAETIRSNVQNGHKTLMRDDFDKLLNGFEEMQIEQKSQGETLMRMDARLDRVDANLSMEREERIAGDRRTQNN